MTQTTSNQKNGGVVAYTASDGTNISLTFDAVQNYIVGTGKKISEQEFVLFTALCKARKLNPLTKEAYLIKYGDAPAQIVVSKDAILKRAVLHPEYDGMEHGVITIDSNGEVRERKGCYYPETEKLDGGWCRVYRKNRKIPEYTSVKLKEVDKGTDIWKKSPGTMVEKVAKSRALRETFVEDLGGMFDADEINVPNVPNEPKETIQKEPDPLDTIEADFKTVNINDL